MAKAAPAYKSRPRRSEKLKSEDMETLKTFISKYEIAEMAADALGITRQTLHRILKKETASGLVAEKIRNL